MSLPQKKLQLLSFVAEHYVVTAAQARRSIFAPAQDKGGRQTRRLLGELLAAHLIQKTNCQVVNPLYGLTCPVYFPSRLGNETLALETGEQRWFQAPAQTPHWQNLAHWVALTDLRITINAAIKAQSVVTMSAWYNEFDTVSNANDPAERYKLYTVVSAGGPAQRRIVCVPDAAFLLQAAVAQEGGDAQSFAKAFYVELERGTNPIQKAAAEKTPGFAHLGDLHKRHFPNANLGFDVLMFAPNPSWRNALCKAIGTREGAHLWKFAALTEVKPETFLTAAIFHKCDGTVVSLLKDGAKS